MKKIIILLALLFISLSAIAQNTRPALIIDTSASMKGFLEGEFRFFMRDVESILNTCNMVPGSYDVIRLGTELSEWNQGMACFSSAEEGTAYTDQNTNLSLAIGYISNRAVPMAVIISDMEMDSSGESATNENSCLKGYDLSCLRIKIANLTVDYGYSFYIIGFRGKYKGKLYPPGEPSNAIVLDKPVSKPVYVLVFSNSKYDSVARSIVSKIMDKLEQYKRDNPDFSFRALKLYPLSCEECTTAFNQVNLESFRSDRPHNKTLVFSKASFSPNEECNIAYKKQNNMSIMEKIPIEIKLNCKKDSLLPEIFEQEMVPVLWDPAVEGLNPVSNNSRYDVVGKTIFLELDSNLTSPLFLRNPKYMKIKIISKPKANKDLPKIWRDWSTTDITSPEYRSGNTLNISDLLEYIVENAIERKQLRANPITIFSYSILFKP